MNFQIRQIYHPYNLWEDYINGMYKFPKQQDEEKYILLAIEMLTNKELFLNTCKEVLINWTISSSVNLTNKQCNRKAWLGQASCNFKYKVPEICTRIAWGKLSIEQQNEANKIAEQVINSFELNYEKQDTELYN
ncbi:hypothetical protein UFOVP916_64 [uncultured Caudovirales phage]|uniref:Uncharacterized protein n=1 Tax=uncultured Caudovirales phage TaxID=2100421 RepID=A0A6J5SUB3_9CAUD|nr:hypothetical protein UFOVP827_19 [uncultured Caudovirales phage]CAB4171493.1 hypothetical protein UFOVP916_64 [uncultured Caudovirales phage]CAB4177331.1 hypothetical protein UFOVP1001_22 [uncultured Caudovirales phage]CAB4199530.1 hypothetical protein UFOVP1338_54 [uncultured Caudovirales phage]CAB4213521.1 hypothetical protein UFOVP1447_49 [uncultured Caudovirales phage]